VPLHLHQRIKNIRNTSPADGLKSKVGSNRDGRESQFDTRGAGESASPIHWVIAFSTTGDRMVLEFYSPQPSVLVLK
jgi:hypothetical protein